MKRLLLFLIVVIITAIFSVSAEAQFVVTFENQGVFKTIKGQVQDGNEEPVINAKVSLTNTNTKTEYNFQTDFKGEFKTAKIPDGEYNVRVEAQGFNITEFSLELNRKNPKALKKFIIVGLSPGCASGGDKVEIVDRIRKEPE